MTALSGCTAVVHPPADVQDRETVLLLDYGRSSGLVLPGEEAAALYVYGDWNYYALGNAGLCDILMALFVPTQGTLGRQEFEQQLAAPEVRRQIRQKADRVYSIEVSRARALALRRRLDRLFRSHIGSRVYAPSLDMEFVHHPQTYTGWRNSNQMVAHWLEQAGAEVRGAALFSSWRIAEPEEQRP